MARVTLTAAAVGLAVGALGFTVVMSLGVNVWNSVFLAVLLSWLLFVAQLAGSAFRAARAQQRRAEELRKASAAEVARVAVNAERERLSRDIEAWLREVLGVIVARAQAAKAETDLRAEALAIQLDAQRATSELRRQLGLLRPIEQPATSAPVPPVIPRAPLSTIDVVLAVLLAALALVEMATYGEIERSWSVVLTTVAALSIIGRHAAPITSALACSAGLVTGALLDQPVQDGFWFVLAIGTLAWALISRQSRGAWLTLLVLIGAALGSRWLHVAENVFINVVCLSVAMLAAAVVARSRRLQVRAQAAAAQRSGELEVAAEDAVRYERFEVARELHDTVSGAVSVIAVQAGAAELLWPTDRVAATRAIEVVESTAQQALAELDRLLSGSTPNQRTMGDVLRLVDRMEAAGLAVRARYDGNLRPEVMPTVYRVIQESLTNALRYAPEGTAEIEISTRAEAAEAETTTVRVVTHGPTMTESTHRGYGLVGLGERVAQAGGTLEISRDPRLDRFEVTAMVPSSARARS